MHPSFMINALITVAKKPIAGQAKTRLSPPLSLEEASQLYECFLLDTVELMSQVEYAQPVIAYMPGEALEYFQEIAPDFQLIPQQGSNLGARLDNAIIYLLSKGYQHVIIMDSDSPTLPESYLDQAFSALSEGSDVVLGPTEDGGYYLIGMNKPNPRLLHEVRMSTPQVAADTLLIAGEEGLSVRLLPAWYDIDDANSLIRLAEELRQSTSDKPTHTRRFLQRQEFNHIIFRHT